MLCISSEPQQIGVEGVQLVACGAAAKGQWMVHIRGARGNTLRRTGTRTAETTHAAPESASLALVHNSAKQQQ